MKEETYPFVMRALPYEPYELAPCISAEATAYHHDRLYKACVDQLNAALADYPVYQGLSLRELLERPENLPESIRTIVVRSGGGVYGHELFFDSMQPYSQEQDPKGPLLEAIIQEFGSLRDFRERIKDAAMSQFASGYAWLVLGQDGKLRVTTTSDQDVPDLKEVIPILNVDVWEHSYYLQYQDRRSDYLNAWHRVINWRKIARRYEEGIEEVRRNRLLRGEIPPEELGGKSRLRGEVPPEELGGKSRLRGEVQMEEMGGKSQLRGEIQSEEAEGKPEDGFLRTEFMFVP